MGCGCNEFDADNPNSNSTCGPCNPCTSSTAECESLPSALDNFTVQFFGSVTKTIVNGKVAWTLPCNLGTGLPDNPRNENEGLACYFLRLFADGIIGLTGATGDPGAQGDDGLSGFTYTASVLTIPPAECPVAQVEVEDATVIPEGVYIFIAGAGWFSVVSKTGNILMLQLIEAVVASGAVIAAGAIVGLTGPEGPQGIRGQTGEKGVKGDKGSVGSSGADGADGAAAQTNTTGTYVQPAVGSTVVVTVGDSSFFVGGMQVYVVSGGYYTIAAVAPGSLTLRNLGIAATNASPAANILAGAIVIAAGVSPVVAAATVVASGTSDPVIDNSIGEIVFDTTPLTIVLPAAGTYMVTLSLSVLADAATAPKFVTARLHNGSTLVGRNLYIPLAGSVSNTATGTLIQRLTVVAATTLVVHAVTNANDAEALSGQCALDWTLINPIT